MGIVKITVVARGLGEERGMNRWSIVDFYSRATVLYDIL